MKIAFIVIATAWVVAIATVAAGQNSALSSYLYFNDNYNGNFLIDQVRVPSGGEAMYTYYETLYWGGAATGYCGIQAHPNGHNYIFSIWDTSAQTAATQVVYAGNGTTYERFGGEGTGMHALNYQVGWNTDTWITTAVRAWPVGNHTDIGYWVRRDDTNAWYHLVTMDVAAPNVPFTGQSVAFIEDWLATGANRREGDFRGGWKRETDGQWFPFGQAQYAINSGDAQSGGRSYNYRNNYNGGVASDASGQYYYLVAGGTTTPTTSVPRTFSIPRPETQPSFATISLDYLTAILANNDLAVDWDALVSTAPQFSYAIKVYDNPGGTGTALLTAQGISPDIHRWDLDASSLNASHEYYVQLSLTDIFDRTTKVSVPTVPEPSTLALLAAAAAAFAGHGIWWRRKAHERDI